MWKVLAAAVIGSAFAGSPAGAQPSDGYAQGAADWRTLQQWFSSQMGDRAEGARYWVANRSVPGHLACANAASRYTPGQNGGDPKLPGGKAAFAAGCRDAKSRLDPIDYQRRSYPKYRAGFSDEATRQHLVAGAAPAQSATRQSGARATGNLVVGTIKLPTTAQSAKRTEKVQAKPDPEFPVVTTEARQQASQMALAPSFAPQTAGTRVRGKKCDNPDQWLRGECDQPTALQRALAEKGKKLRAGYVGVARALGVIPGAIVCADFATVRSMFNWYSRYWEDMTRRRLLGNARIEQLEGPAATAPPLEENGCVLVPDRTQVTIKQEPEMLLPTISGHLSSGQAFTGVTLPDMYSNP